MFGLTRKKPAPEPALHMPYEEEVLAMGPGDHLILFWKGRPIYMRPASVLDIEEDIEWEGRTPMREIIINPAAILEEALE